MSLDLLEPQPSQNVPTISAAYAISNPTLTSIIQLMALNARSKERPSCCISKRTRTVLRVFFLQCSSAPNSLRALTVRVVLGVSALLVFPLAVCSSLPWSMPWRFLTYLPMKLTVLIPTRTASDHADGVEGGQGRLAIYG